MAKKQREEPNTSEWMNTYSDLVTLLLCFFVLLFSMSTINAEKWENFVKAFANPGDKTMQVVIDALEDKADGGIHPRAGRFDAPDRPRAARELRRAL